MTLFIFEQSFQAVGTELSAADIQYRNLQFHTSSFSTLKISKSRVNQLSLFEFLKKQSASLGIPVPRTKIARNVDNKITGNNVKKRKSKKSAILDRKPRSYYYHSFSEMQISNKNRVKHLQLCDFHGMYWF